MGKGILIISILVVGVISYTNARGALESRSELQILNHVMRPFIGEDIGAFFGAPKDYRPSNEAADIDFYLYTNPMDVLECEKIEFDDTSAIKRLKWYPNAPVKILIHGFTQSQNSSMPAMIKNAYLEHMRNSGTDNVNIVVVDWGRLAGSLGASPLPIYTRAVRNVEQAGKRVGELIVKLEQLGIVTFDNVHVIGFSLGAHVAGWAGMTVQEIENESIGRLTGLDPAGPLFYANITNFTGRDLMKTDAKWVDVIHTSWGTYGMAKEIGHVDFYPNFGLGFIQTQPYCLVILANQRPLQVCSHNMATVFYSMSILRDLSGCKCTNYRTYVTYCRQVCYEPVTFGEYLEANKTGGIYLNIPRLLLQDEMDTTEDLSILGNDDMLRSRSRGSSQTMQQSPRESGRLIGFELVPTNMEQVAIINQMRDSPDGYLFWSGKVALREQVNILVPETLRTKFMMQTSKFALSKIRFDPVNMDIMDKDVSDARRMGKMSELQSLASKISAPFTEIALRRLPQMLTTHRAIRSTDVIIYNSVGKSFRLNQQSSNCATGMWSSNFAPEMEIDSHSSIVYGAESSGFLTGITECTVHYVATDGSAFKVSISNPYSGLPHVTTHASKELRIKAVQSRGNNNIVRFTIY